MNMIPLDKSAPQSAILEVISQQISVLESVLGHEKQRL